MITQERLKELVIYDPDTGVFTAKAALRARSEGDTIGWDNGLGYLCAAIDGLTYTLGSLALLYMTGGHSKRVRFLNGVRHDNRWCNLRVA